MVNKSVFIGRNGLCGLKNGTVYDTETYPMRDDLLMVWVPTGFDFYGTYPTVTRGSVMGRSFIVFPAEYFTELGEWRKSRIEDIGI